MLSLTEEQIELLEKLLEFFKKDTEFCAYVCGLFWISNEQPGT
jgi:hypothetical protein